MFTASPSRGSRRGRVCFSLSMWWQECAQFTQVCSTESLGHETLLCVYSALFSFLEKSYFILSSQLHTGQALPPSLTSNDTEAWDGAGTSPKPPSEEKVALGLQSRSSWLQNWGSLQHPTLLPAQVCTEG